MTGFINTDFYGLSAFVSMTTNYYDLDLLDGWGRATTYLGSKHSDFGSWPQRQAFSLSSADISGALSLVSSLLIPTPRFDHDPIEHSSIGQRIGA